MGGMIEGNDPMVRMIMDQRAAQKSSQKFFNARHLPGPNTNKRDVNQVLHNGAWRGRRCFIIAGGPSVADYDLSLLENELTIGINRVYEIMTPTILFAMDGTFHQNIMKGINGPEAKAKFNKYRGLKLWMDIANHKLISDVFFIRGQGRTGISYDLGQGLFHGNNSGFGALNLAIVLGANPIYLIGYDMKFRKGKGHYHTGHNKVFTEKMMKSFQESFVKTHAGIKSKGFKVININRDTALKCYPIIPDLPDDLNKNKRPVYVSFYTKKTLYENKKDKLKDSFLKYSLEHDIKGISNMGQWIDNVKYKPHFILKMMQKYKGHPIVWIDCDAEVQGYPVYFDKIKQSFSAYFRSRKRRKTATDKEELLSGTLFFRNNKSTHELVKMWIEETEQAPNDWDQWTLERAFKRWDGSYKKMPSSYCCIFDGFEKSEGVVPIIEHYQASREIRRQQWRI